MSAYIVMCVCMCVYVHTYDCSTPVGQKGASDSPQTGVNKWL